MYREHSFDGSGLVSGRETSAAQHSVLVDALHNHLLRHPTATAALNAWCLAHDIGDGPIRAIPLTPQQRPISGTAASDVRNTATRRVCLSRGGAVLSYATLQYRRSVLPGEVLTALMTTTTPFGALIAEMAPRRVTTRVCFGPGTDAVGPSRHGSRRHGWSGRSSVCSGGGGTVLTVHATVYCQHGIPVARVREAYTSTLIVGASRALNSALI